MNLDKIPELSLNFFNLIWGLSFWNVFPLGLILILISLLISDRRSLLVLAGTYIVLVPYLPTKPIYMHSFTAAMALALWAGCSFQSIFLAKRKAWKLSLTSALTLFLLLSWVLFYIWQLPPYLRDKDRPNRVVAFVHRIQPDPPADTCFRLDGVDLSQSLMDESYFLYIVNDALKVAYQRPDISATMPGMPPEGSKPVIIKIPRYIN